MQILPDKKNSDYSKSNTERTPHKTQRSPYSLHNNNEKRHNYLYNLTKEDEASDLQLKLAIQANIIKEYESWVYRLLNIINEKAKSNDHVNIGSEIQNGLERIEKYVLNNYAIKQKIINEQEKNQMLKNRKSELQSDLINKKAEYKNQSVNQLSNELKQLSSNLQILVDELDTISELNNRLLKTKEKLSKQYYAALEDFDALKKETMTIKKMKMVKRKTLHVIFNYNDVSKQNKRTTIDNYTEKSKKLHSPLNQKKSNLFLFDSEDETNNNSKGLNYHYV